MTPSNANSPPSNGAPASASSGSRRRIVVATPLRRSLAIELGDGRVVASAWTSPRTMAPNARRAPDAALAREVARQIAAFFARELPVFDLPLALEGTSFDIAVWEAVMTIRFGSCVPYGEVARAIGRDGAHRGVARALSHAPLDLFIPAHRVIGADGHVRGAAPRSMRLRLLAFEAKRGREPAKR